jgi:hypothetical protein
MSLSFKTALLALAGVLTLITLSPISGALAQTPQAGAPTSVLPTGGGAALLDPSDTVFLLLDHQAGLFKPSKTSVWESFAQTPRCSRSSPR